MNSSVDPVLAAGAAGARLEQCPGCGVELPPAGEVKHPYVGASSGCWAVYGDVLAREYGEWGYPSIHRLTVETYGAQHPGERTAKAVQTVGLHLIALYLAVERGVEPARITQQIGRLVSDPSAFRWLAPPGPGGQLTILEVEGARDLRDHASRVQRWARSVWESWAPHHETIKHWAGR